MSGAWQTRAALAALVLVSLTVCGWVAAADPTPGRAWDERYSMQNIAGILASGDLRPVAPYYPSLSHLPQTAVLAVSHGLHRATGWQALAIFKANGHFTPTAFILCRWTNVLFGGATLLLTFLIGRRVFSARIGLLAAALLAVSPWFIRSAAIYKPDPLLTLLTAVTFLWALRAAERETLGAYLLAGAGVGLATSSKHTGVLAALPIVAVALHGWRKKVSWLRLMAAGVMSFAVFMAINPYPDQLDSYIWQISGYAGWAEAASAADPQPSTLIYALKLQFGAGWHGPVVGTAAILGLLGLSIQPFRRSTERTLTLQRALVGLFPIAFILVCAVINSYAKANFFTPTQPFTALAAAWSFSTMGSAVLRKLPAGSRRWAQASAAVALVAVTVPDVTRYVYDEAVRGTTLQETRRRIARTAAFLGQRTLIYESAVGNLQVDRKRFDRSGGQKTLSVHSRAVERLADIDPTTLDLADFEVFPKSRLQGSEREFYLDRVDRDGREALSIEPVPLRRKGKSHVLLAHPWRPIRDAVPIAWRPIDRPKSRRLKGRLPSILRLHQAISFDLELSSRQAERCELLLGGEPVALYEYSRAQSSVKQMSERFLLAQRGQKIELRCARARLLRTPPTVAVWRWNPQVRGRSAASVAQETSRK